jgi:hypothetical protein
LNTVKAEDLRAGMVLAQPLKDLAGRTLLKEGAELTEIYIERIRKWGFEEVAVEGGEDDPVVLPPVVGYPVAGRSWEEVRAEVERRFSKSGINPAVVRIKKAVLARVRELVDLHAGH